MALVTGAAGGIGSATAERYLSEGACVVLADIDADALAKATEALGNRFSDDVVHQGVMNVTDEAQVTRDGTGRCRIWRGHPVSNAGIASSAPIEETSLALWQKNTDILSTGYFLVSREAFKLFRAQDMGGSVVFIGSKNALAAS